MNFLDIVDAAVYASDVCGGWVPSMRLKIGLKGEKKTASRAVSRSELLSPVGIRTTRVRVAFVAVSLVAFGVAYAAPLVSALRLPTVSPVEPLPQLVIPAISFPTLAVPKLQQPRAVPTQATTAPPAAPSRRSVLPRTPSAPTAPKRVTVPVLESSYGIPGKQAASGAASKAPADPFATVPVVSNDTGVPVTLPVAPAADASAAKTPPAAGTDNATATPPASDAAAGSDDVVPGQATDGGGGDHLTAASAPGADMAPTTLTSEAAGAALAQATSEWTAVKPDAKLGSVTVEIADLPGLELGNTSGNTITIDATAAGYGWTVMHPGDDRLRMDLLTVVRHELGHVLGLDHGDGLMAPTLAAGESRAVPTVAPVKESAPATTTSGSTESSTTQTSGSTSEQATSTSSAPATTSPSSTSAPSSAPATSTGSGNETDTRRPRARPRRPHRRRAAPSDSTASTSTTGTTVPTVAAAAAPTVATAATWVVSLADGGTHDVSVAVVGTDVVVTVDGVATSRPVSDVTNVTIAGGSGDDSVGVAGSLGSVAVSFDGGGGTDTVRGPRPTRPGTSPAPGSGRFTGGSRSPASSR